MLTFDEIDGVLSDEYGSIEIHFWSTSKTAMLWSFRVRDEHQNQGHGQRIMAETIRLCTERGFDCQLDVEAHNENARHLYEKFGFTYTSSGCGGLIYTMHRPKELPLCESHLGTTMVGLVS